MRYSFEEFLDIIRKLRAPEGCPWDKEQTHESLRPCMIEEAYEVIDSIDNKDMNNLKEELGDVLLQVVMHSMIAEEEKEFTIEDVISEIAEKMIRRHPHVFGEISAETSDVVLKNWEEIKKQEKQETTLSAGLKRVPKSLPANIRAAKILKKAAEAGFEQKDREVAFYKAQEELGELLKVMETNNNREIQEKYGDLLFSLINLSRFLEISAENSLTNAINKFINRFEGIECLTIKGKQDLGVLTIDEKRDLW